MLRNFAYKRHLIVIGVCLLLLGVMVPLASFAKSPASASTSTSSNGGGKGHAIAVVPFEYDPGHTETVEATWAPGQGDNTGGKNEALLLTKLTTTATNSASGANISNVKGIVLTEIGWDVRDNGHCGAGAPRFNVTTSDNVTHFIGCASPPPTTSTPVGPDANGFTWHRNRYDPTTAFPPIGPTETVKSIQIVFDEGVDVGQGWTFLDNIDINGTIISQGTAG
jgi:hypothetical protein